MTFLPIVDRELRVAARRRSTYRIRTWAAVIALVVGLCSFLPILLGLRMGSAGKELFTTLTGFAFGLCLLAGVLLTADCLSAEKREGTLGLLFLTDLRGYDVVLGKLMAMSLNAFYGLLAILPITGLCLLLGGLTGGEFWRTNLALINTLFFSMAAGLCVSAFGRDSQRVMGGTLGVVILIAALPAVAVGKLGASLRIPAVCSNLEWISPFCPFAHALESEYLWQPEKYWWALLASQLFGWLMLALASGALLRCWQERAAVAESGRALGRFARRSGEGPAARTKPGEKLLSVNPVLWLMSRRPDVRRVAWVIVGAWGVVVLAVSLFARSELRELMLREYGAQLFGYLLKGLVALQACRFFVEARRNGTLEMLLCTPLTSQDILRGQALALKRTFLWPIVTFLALLFVPGVVQALTAPIWKSREMGFASFEFLSAGYYSLLMYADCYALRWFGIWLSLTLKRPGLAPALTIVLVLVLPSVLLCGFTIFTDLVFIAWGVIGVHGKDLRLRLARQYQPAAGDGRPRFRSQTRTP